MVSGKDSQLSHQKMHYYIIHFTYLVYLGLKTAFDTVSHDLLLHKLKDIGLNLGTVEWFSSYLEGKSQMVKMNGTLLVSYQLTMEYPKVAFWAQPCLPCI